MPHNQPVIPITTTDDHHFELIHARADHAVDSLLLIPGMGLSARQYIAFAEALAGHGIEVFIHEWRGIGSSDLRASRSSNWGYRELIELDLHASVDAAVKHTGREQLLMGGHSLGSQFACMLSGRMPHRCKALVLIAGGAPYWRTFGFGMKLLMLAVIAGFPAIATMRGHYPGKRLGFAGRESRGVIFDWARTARTGRYRPRGIDTDLESAMASIGAPALAIAMADDWFVPESSLRWLTGKLKNASITYQIVDAEEKVDHYKWMKQPEVTTGKIVQWMKDNSLL